MSYTIFFDDKFARLSDGRLIYFSRHGCNNDNAGRGRDEYHARIYTDEALEEYIESLKEGSSPVKEKPEEAAFKIRSRWASYYDFGNHLERMVKRAVSFDDMKEKRRLRGKVLDRVEVSINGGEHKSYTPSEWDKAWASVIYGSDKVETIYHSHYIYDEKEFVDAIENKAAVEFYVGEAR